MVEKALVLVCVDQHGHRLAVAQQVDRVVADLADGTMRSMGPSVLG